MKRWSIETYTKHQPCRFASRFWLVPFACFVGPTWSCSIPLDLVESHKAPLGPVETLTPSCWAPLRPPVGPRWVPLGSVGSSWVPLGLLACPLLHWFHGLAMSYVGFLLSVVLDWFAFLYAMCWVRLCCCNSELSCTACCIRPYGSWRAKQKFFNFALMNFSIGSCLLPSCTG